MIKPFKGLSKYLVYSIIISFLFFIGALISVNTPAVQTTVTKKYLEYFNREFGTSLSVKQVDINFFGDIYLYDIKALDDHKNALISVPKLKARTDLIGLILKPEDINLRALKLYDPQLNITTYYGEKKNNLDQFIQKFDKKENHYSKILFRGNIEIENGFLTILDENLKPRDVVILQTENLNSKVEDLKIQGKDISAELCSLQSSGRYDGNNFQLDKFSMNITFTSKSLILETIDVKTPKSHVKGALSFKYDKPEDFKYFNKKVHIKTEIRRGSKLSFQDLSLFVDHWDSKSNVQLAGKISGKASEELLLTDIELQSDDNQIKSDEIKLFKITSSKDYRITQKKGLIRTYYNGLQKLLPSNLAKKIPHFIKNYGQLSLYGALSVEPKKLSAKGTLSSEAIGSLYANIELNDYTSEQIRYEGRLSADKLHLATLTGNEKLQSISGTLDFKGVSLSPKNLEISLKGNLSQAVLYSRSLDNVHIDGKLNGFSFQGLLDAKDIKGKVNFDSKVNFSQKNPSLEAKINIEKADLHALGFTEKGKSLLSAKAEIQLKGLDMSKIEGKISMYQNAYETRAKTFKIPEIKLQGIIEGEKKKILLEATNIVKGEITGNSSWDSWPGLLKNALKRLTNEEGKNAFEKENYLTFNLNAENTLAEILEENFSLPSTNRLRGKIGPGHNIKLDIFIEKAQLKGNVFENVQLTTDELTGELLQLKIDKALVQGMVLKDITLSGVPQGKLLKINSRFIAEWNGSEQLFELNFYKQGNWSDKERKLYVGLNRSKMVINGHNWWINERDDNQTHKVKIDLNKNTYFISKIELTSSEGQRLELSADFRGKDYKYIQGMLDNLQLKRLIPRKDQDKTIDGLVNGEFSIENSNNIFRPSVKLNIDKISIDNMTFGNLKFTSSYDEKNKNHSLEGYLENKGTEIFRLVGFIKNKKQQKAQLDLTLAAQKLPLGSLEGFLGGVFSNMRGSAQGEIKISGAFDNPLYKGVLELQGAGMKVDYLNTEYKLTGRPLVNISTDLIQFENFHFEDVQYHTQGNLRIGKLYREKSKLNLNFSIESQNMLLINTSSAHNKFFYGTIFASALKRENGVSAKPFTIDISGETDNLKVQVKNVRINGLSQLSINTQGNKTTEKMPGYICFKGIHNPSVKDAIENASYVSIENNKKKGISIDIETFIDSNAQIKLIMDEYADNFINAKGEGHIFLKMESGGDLQMTGSNYKIFSGIYQFSNEQIPFLKLDKKFNIRPGGTILWGGDPMNATLDIQAFYPKTVSNVGEYINLSNTAGFSDLSTELNIYISGALLKPEIAFDIKFLDAPENIRQQLAERLNTSDKILTQFGLILLLGKFFLDTKDIIGGGLSSSGYDIALKQLGNILSSIHNSLSINFEYVQGNRDTNTSNSFRSSISYNISRRFNLKGTLGVPLTVKQQKSVFTGDIQLNIDISKEADKSLTFALFSRPSTFGQEREEIQSATFSSQTHGAGIIYTTQFDNFKELKQKLFSKKKSEALLEKGP
ncbi:translocation/assembly module TamB domain-containing protein [Bacteroidetes bacterium endosymbiont of Geopemphigus sp.]|uniref:translocation/assembly module TamB domain-containing protein n=1 Tax=Bacteroidetes bacterium endosymbiont of Geopemphigus sp. TaxID=2047937 RepID=UPI0011AEDE85|nr:hypothetical protein [Bacteroidetes bacterium endosymbiont of Geopemphigus sp.]